MSDWKFLNGGIPQGTKLGVILFTVMTTNSLLKEWNLRIKFVDDTTALEILPRNSISLVANDIYNFSSDQQHESKPPKVQRDVDHFHV